MGATQSAPVEVYGFGLSQPTRSVLLLCSVGKVSVDFKLVDALKGDHKKEEYLAVNPMGFVPAIKDPSFGITEGLGEGAAILAHIAETRKLTSLYPSGPAPLRAKINMWMHWHHTNTRKLTMKVLVPKVLLKDDSACKAGLEEVKPMLAFLEKHLANNGTKFLVSDTPTIADILIAPELDQMPYFGLLEYKEYPAISKFLEAIAELEGYAENIKGVTDITNPPAAATGV